MLCLLKPGGALNSSQHFLSTLFVSDVLLRALTQAVSRNPFRNPARRALPSLPCRADCNKRGPKSHSLKLMYNHIKADSRLSFHGENFVLWWEIAFFFILPDYEILNVGSNFTTVQIMEGCAKPSLCRHVDGFQASFAGGGQFAPPPGWQAWVYLQL